MLNVHIPRERQSGDAFPIGILIFIVIKKMKHTSAQLLSNIKNLNRITLYVYARITNKYMYLNNTNNYI